MITLKDLKKTELKESRFGRPAPRHGLKLLFWFAKDAVDFDERGNMVLLCDPREGHFGFHHFGNFEKILPELQKPGEEKYFEVGNLKPDTYPGSRDLPDYVRGDYDGTWRNGEHNKDRVIVRLKGRNVVTEVYVTEHEASSNNFDPKRTHLVTPDTVRLIREPHLELEDFLYKTGYSSKLRYCLFKCLRCFH
uniref:Uncharacterized protein n=1 Tax=Scleropages formosus TaxID=113540 RepID=A0A8C9RMN2_SCLFO